MSIIMSRNEMSFFSISRLLFLIYLLLVCSSVNAQNTRAQSNSSSNTVFEVGVVLDLSSIVGRIGMTSLSLALSDFYSANANYSTRLVLHVRDSNGPVIDAAASALSLLKDVRVDAIIGPQKSAQASFVIGLGDRANVPIISFSATSPYLRSQSPYFVQTALNDAAQVGAIASVVQHFHWSQVVVIYEESDYGSGIIPYLSNAFQDINVRISYRSIIPLSATDDFILKELYKMKTMQTRVFVVHISSSLASRFFPKVQEAEMMTKGYAWIVTSGVMDLLTYLDPDAVDSMEGVIGVKPLIPRSNKLISTSEKWRMKFMNDNPDIVKAELNSYGVWAYDTLWALAMAAESGGVKVSSSLQNTTDLFATEISQIGPKLQKAISGVTFQRLGGIFRLANGQLGSSPFQIINVVGNKEIEVGVWTPSRGISRSETNTSGNNIVTSTCLNKELMNVTFPGNSSIVPKGWEVPMPGKKLKVGVPEGADLHEFVKVEKDPQTNGFKISGAYIDIFNAVMAALPYSVPYEYMPFRSSSPGSHDELVYQVFLQAYDAALGSISITSNRSKYVDYTLPFGEGGITMTVPVYENPNSRWIFLSPLTKELWLTAIALFIWTGIALWILEHRFNNAFRGPLSQHAGMIFYFPFMGLVASQSERVVNNLARVVVVVWMFVVLILSSTYTASLSARLTVERLQPVVTDIKELIDGGDHIGVREGSFVFDFVQTLGFHESKIKTYSSLEDIDRALSNGSHNGGVSAFFCVMPSTKLLMSKYCGKYTTIGQMYPTEGIAYAFQKGSPLVADISRAIIQLTESGKISAILGHWIKNQSCNGLDATITTSSVSLQSFKTLFGITGGITGSCLVIFLVSYLYKNRDFVRRIFSNSNTTLWSKARALCKHFDQRDPKSFRGKAREEDDGRDSAPPPPPPPVITGILHASSTVVPISSPELIISDDVEHGGDIITTPSPDHTPAEHHGQTGAGSASAFHLETVRVVDSYS